MCGAVVPEPLSLTAQALIAKELTEPPKVRRLAYLLLKMGVAAGAIHLWLTQPVSRGAVSGRDVRTVCTLSFTLPLGEPHNAPPDRPLSRTVLARACSGAQVAPRQPQTIRLPDAAKGVWMLHDARGPTQTLNPAGNLLAALA